MKTNGKITIYTDIKKDDTIEISEEEMNKIIESNDLKNKNKKNKYYAYVDTMHSSRYYNESLIKLSELKLNTNKKLKKNKMSILIKTEISNKWYSIDTEEYELNKDEVYDFFKIRILTYGMEETSCDSGFYITRNDPANIMYFDQRYSKLHESKTSKTIMDKISEILKEVKPETKEFTEVNAMLYLLIIPEKKNETIKAMSYNGKQGEHKTLKIHKIKNLPNKEKKCLEIFKNNKPKITKYTLEYLEKNTEYIEINESRNRLIKKIKMNKKIDIGTGMKLTFCVSKHKMNENEIFYAKTINEIIKINTEITNKTVIIIKKQPDEMLYDQLKKQYNRKITYEMVWDDEIYKDGKIIREPNKIDTSDYNMEGIKILRKENGKYEIIDSQIKLEKIMSVEQILESNDRDIIKIKNKIENFVYKN
jgi:hypothetical protein